MTPINLPAMHLASAHEAQMQNSLVLTGSVLFIVSYLTIALAAPPIAFSLLILLSYCSLNATQNLTQLLQRVFPPAQIEPSLLSRFGSNFRARLTPDFPESIKVLLYFGLALFPLQFNYISQIFLGTLFSAGFGLHFSETHIVQAREQLTGALHQLLEERARAPQATQRENLEHIKLLLDNGADPNGWYNGQMAWHILLAHPQADMVWIARRFRQTTTQNNGLLNISDYLNAEYWLAITHTFREPHIQRLWHNTFNFSSATAPNQSSLPRVSFWNNLYELSALYLTKTTELIKDFAIVMRKMTSGLIYRPQANPVNTHGTSLLQLFEWLDPLEKAALKVPLHEAGFFNSSFSAFPEEPQNQSREVSPVLLATETQPPRAGTACITLSFA